jgi:hypothetical protein
MPKVHEWKIETVWKECLNEQLQKLEREGWEIHQFYGNVMIGGDVIGVMVVLKKEAVNELPNEGIPGESTPKV